MSSQRRGMIIKQKLCWNGMGRIINRSIVPQNSDAEKFIYFDFRSTRKKSETHKVVFDSHLTLETNTGNNGATK